MIAREFFNLINRKLRSVIIYLIIIGLLFFILAVAILFYPQVLQFLFVLSFFSFAFLALLIALKINHIKQNLDKILSLLPQKRKAGK